MVYALISENGHIKKDSDVLDKFFENYDPNKPIVIHFHGGLVPEKAGLETANRLHEVYSNADGHPIFFVWKSGLIDTLTHNLSEIWKEPLFQRLMLAILRLVVGQMTDSSGVKSQSGNTPASRKLVEEELKKEDSFSEYDYGNGETLEPSQEQIIGILQEYRINELLESVASADSTTKSVVAQEKRETLIDESIVEEVEAGVNNDSTKSITISASAMLVAIKHTGKIINRVLDRFRKGRDHGVHATVTEEIFREFYLANVGQLVWKLMKKDTEDAFLEDTGRAGSEFLKKLAKVIEDGRNPRVVLVGHSTGAVYINNFLKAASAKLPAETNFDIIFLAAACTFKSFAEILQEHKGKIKNIRAFGMKDSFEKRDQLLTKVPIYPHSLLYFVSGICEDEPDEPILGMERFFIADKFKQGSEFQAIIDVASFLSNGKVCTYWSQCSDGPGFNTMSRSHGAFDNDEETLKSVQHVIKGGY